MKTNQTNKGGDLGLFDLLFIFLLTTSTAERFLLPGIADQLQSGEIRPMWAMVAVIFLFLEPYKQIVYLLTIIVSSIWIIMAIYKSWQKRRNQ